MLIEYDLQLQFSLQELDVNNIHGEAPLIVNGDLEIQTPYSGYLFEKKKRDSKSTFLFSENI